jgi:Trypsin-like peptidase domain
MEKGDAMASDEAEPVRLPDGAGEESGAPADPWDAKRAYAEFRDAVVPVITVDRDGDEHIATAFHVGDGVFVTAKHVVADMQSCSIEVRGSDGDRRIAIEAFGHSKETADVAGFRVRDMAYLPAVPLGSHLDDWINDPAFVLNEVLILGYPPIPLSKHNVLIAARGQVNAVIDLYSADHVHFVVSGMARGGLSGGVVLSEWGFALGVITASLVHNGEPEQLGFLTVLSVEPILQCLGEHRLLPRADAEMWDGLFTDEWHNFTSREGQGASSWVCLDRDGWRARVSYIAANPETHAQLDAIIERQGDFARAAPVGVETRWEFSGHYDDSTQPMSDLREALTEALLQSGLVRVAH